jgi:uncharacterized protein (DUF924 family)
MAHERSECVSALDLRDTRMDMTDAEAQIRPETVLSFWFSDEVKAKWWVKEDAFDEAVRARFGAAFEAARNGAMDHWAETPEGALALVILLDQVPRNSFRGTPRAFSGDYKALAIAKAAIDRGFDAALPSDRRNFLYMPFQHSERLEDQERGMGLFASNDVTDGLKYMTLHRDIIAHFGRFPHRNSILGRVSTREELDFLQQPGSSF